MSIDTAAEALTALSARDPDPIEAEERAVVFGATSFNPNEAEV